MPVNIVGTDQSQVFSVRGSELANGSIDGGGGIDTLELRDLLYPQTFDFTNLTTFQNIEVIKGVIEVAKIRIRADQLAHVTTIDSDGSEHLDQVTIVGTNIDLRQKSFIGRLEILPETANAEIHVSDLAAASLIKPNVRGTHVRIQNGELTPAQRIALYDQGIDVVTDGAGVTTMASGPVLTALQGDTINYETGEMVLDVGSNATVVSGGHLKSLVAKFVGTKSLFDTLDLDFSPHLKVEGKNAEGENRLFYDNVEIGSVFREASEGSLHFNFNGNATVGHVQEVVRSITYLYDFAFHPSSGLLKVEFTLQDAGGRVAKATSSIRFGPEPVPQPDPVSGTDGNDILNGSASEDVLKGLLGDDILKGLAGRDDLDGGAGNDRLWGGAGNDTLKGDAGRDIFVFDTKASKSTNRDKIVDFKVKDDSIWLENKVFAKIGKSGSEKKPAQLKKDFFVKGSKAKDKNDYVIYDNKKGVLLYDADGSGKGKAVEVATLSKKLSMTYKDFFVI
jgi:Ca2+-binding RTX toxin-like protein